MTYQLTVIYEHPEDPAAFDSHYEVTHACLARQLPGLQSFTVSRPEPAPREETAGAYLVAELRFADRAAFTEAVTSDAGRAVTADLASFATAGATILAGEVTSYL